MNTIQNLYHLENNNQFAIYDNSTNLIFPNLQKNIPSSSLLLPNHIFTNYLDYLLTISSTLNNNVCKTHSSFVSEYFISIDFQNFKYKIPQKLKNDIEMCNFNNKRIIIIPIILLFNKKDAHSNIIIIDNFLNTIEFFEPHGNTFSGFETPFDIQYHILNSISLIDSVFSPLFYTFKNVHNNCPIGLQFKSQINNNEGFCLAWSLLFINIKLFNPITSTDYIINTLLSFSKNDLNLYIRRFLQYLEINFHTHSKKHNTTLKYNMQFENSEKNKIEGHILELLGDIRFDLLSDNIKQYNASFKKLEPFFNYPRFNELFYDIFYEELDSDKSNNSNISNISEKSNDKYEDENMESISEISDKDEEDEEDE